MTEFSTTSLLEIEVSKSSLKSARNTIQELGNVEVDVNATASNQLSPQNKRPAGKERAMSRQLLTDQTTHLQTATDQLTENLDLNRERNDLLREIRDAQELTARESGDGGGRMRGLGSAGLGMAGAGVIIAGSLATQLMSVNWGQTIGNAIPDIGAGDIIGTTATVGASTLISSAADLSPGDVVNATGVAASNLIASAAEIGSGDLIGSAIELSASDVIKSAFEVTASALIASPFALAATNLVESPVSLTPGDVVNPASLSPGDIIDMPSGGIPIVDIIIGGIGLGSAAALAKGAGSAASGTAAAVSPMAALPASMVAAFASGDDSVGEFYADNDVQMKTHTGKETDPISAFLTNTIGRFVNPGSASQTTTTSSGGRNDMSQQSQSVEVTNDVTIDNGGQDDRTIERIVNRRLDEFERNTQRDLQRQ